MQIIVLANDQQKEELLNNATDDEVRVTATNTVEPLTQYQNCDAIIDLLFDGSSERIKLLKTFSEKPVIINSVILTLQRIDVSFVRMNAWPGFMKRSIVEASTSNKNIVEQVEEVFSKVGKKVQWVPDKPGFITARVIAMIINEAWFALGEGISTPKEIDAAMKLGT
ncbi:MAG TPA: 3-hydroxyacyl-CoA dehydrogenase family protein, partial [Chitinophagaceae bacterium]|nr:3-hydroxyacyl-CoA dehydrogenase family protein [Chitinophagaceae bacterium]